MRNWRNNKCRKRKRRLFHYLKEKRLLHKTMQRKPPTCTR
nr:MAG TPA: hypothetical protein [Caudoviricetes sp.]